MNALHAVLVALVVAVTMTSVAGAGPGAARQRVALTTQAVETTHASPFVCRPEPLSPTRAR